jgi:aspartate carbamoyltransferase regulatory subunit
MPNNLIEANSQSTFLKNRVISHLGSSPTKSLIAIDHINKGMKVAMHRMALLKAENQKLQLAMELLSKRQRTKKNTSTQWKITFCTGS